MNTAVAQPTTTQDAVSERITFTLFIAIAFHALIILGFAFSINLTPKVTPTLEITIATQRTTEEPDAAEYLAQVNQEASGNEDKSKQITTDQVAELHSNQINEIAPLPQVKKSNPADPKRTTITTTSESVFKAAINEVKESTDEEITEGQDQITTAYSSEIATLRARLDQQKQAIARRPRVKRLTSVATKASVDAAYLAEWTRKVESVGTKHFPEIAVRQGIYGSLRMITTLRADGSVYSVEITQSSGHALLDNAAVKIAHLASPFRPFPQEIRKEADHLEIIRTWNFNVSGLSTSID